jgi:hypothetical protein
MHSNTQKLIASQFSKANVFDCVREPLTRRWNGWHSEKHCVFTAGGKRVNHDILCTFYL